MRGCIGTLAVTAGFYMRRAARALLSQGSGFGSLSLDITHSDQDSNLALIYICGNSNKLHLHHRDMISTFHALDELKQLYREYN